MEIKRKTEIFIRTNRRFVISQSEQVRRFLCPQCGQEMHAAETFAVMLGLSRRAIYKIVESNAAHFIETDEGVVLVCTTSAAKFLENDAKSPPSENSEPITDSMAGDQSRKVAPGQKIKEEDDERIF